MDIDTEVTASPRGVLPPLLAKHTAIVEGRRMASNKFYRSIYHLLSADDYDSSEALRLAGPYLSELKDKAISSSESKIWGILAEDWDKYQRPMSIARFFDRASAYTEPALSADLQAFAGMIQTGVIARYLPCDTVQVLLEYEEERDISRLQRAYETGLQIFSDKVLVKGQELTGYEEAIRFISNNLSELGTISQTSVKTSLDDYAGEDAYAYYLEEQHQLATRPRILTGLAGIDGVTRGFREGELISILGSPGDGKSCLCVNIAYNAWLRGSNVVYISLEMPGEDIQRRIHVRHAYNRDYFHRPAIRAMAYLDYNLTEEEADFLFREVIPSFAGASKGTFRTLEPRDVNYTFQTLKSELLRLNEERPIDLVVVDYPNLMDVTSPYAKLTRDEGMSRLYIQLKGLCRSFCGGQKITMIIPTQVNRAGRKAADASGTGSYDLSAIAQHSEIANSSDFVFSIYTDAVLREGNECLIDCLKSRRTSEIPATRYKFERAYGVIDNLDYTPVPLASFDQSYDTFSKNKSKKGTYKTKKSDKKPIFIKPIYNPANPDNIKFDI